MQSDWLINMLFGIGMAIIVPVIFIAVIFAIFWAWTLNNVPPYEAHILTSVKGKVLVFDGNGRYHFFPHFHKRIIIPKTIMEIETPLIKNHDIDNLPFGVELACKIQIVDPKRAAKTLGYSAINDIKNYVEDTIMSAMRSQSMQRNLLDIMRHRDSVEIDIFQSTQEALAKIGIEVILFDIKNIVDVDKSKVIFDLEQVKSAELSRISREAKAIQESKAQIIESQKTGEAEVVRQESIQKKEEARIRQEIAVAERTKELKEREMIVMQIDQQKRAEIERGKLLIQAESQAERQKHLAEANAEAILIQARAEAEAIRLKKEAEARAEAEAIRLKMEAEAEGTEKLAEALTKLEEAGLKLKLEEIRSQTAIESAKAIGEGIKNNTKIFLPVNNDNANSGFSSIIASLLPGLTLIDEYKKAFKKEVSSENIDNVPAVLTES